MFVPISPKLINAFSHNWTEPWAILIHNSFLSKEMKYMGNCYYFLKHFHNYFCHIWSEMKRDVSYFLN